MSNTFDSFMEKAERHIPSERFTFLYSFQHPLVGEACKPSRSIWLHLTVPKIHDARYRRIMSLLLRKWIKCDNHNWTYRNSVHLFTLFVSQGPPRLTMLGSEVDTPFSDKLLKLLING